MQKAIKEAHENGKGLDLESMSELISKVEVNARDIYGQTPLHLAVRDKRIVLVKALVENRANINARDEKVGEPLFIMPLIRDGKSL
ncbi:MAG: ankyrin repeat domain-containing protein [Bdellovibrionales bacterium]|nr:ankyrin repeat domain-containing protein [Bdellovibrionales bacterium]